MSTPGGLATASSVLFYSKAGRAHVYDDRGEVELGSGGSVSAPLNLTLDDAGTNNSPTVLTIGHTTSGTAGVQFGSILAWALQDSAGNTDTAATWRTRWTSATSGSETSEVTVTMMLNGSLNESLYLSASGDLTSRRYTSTVATGTAPLAVSSTTVVSHLNADLLDGQEGSYYRDPANLDTTGASDGDVLTVSSGAPAWVAPAASVPTGAIQMYGGSTIPSGWLECDGSAVSRTTYADLYSAIGTTWGAGDGSTTFNVPDLRGRTPIGAGTGSGLTARTLGDTVGAETHQLTESEMPSHDHNRAAAPGTTANKLSFAGGIGTGINSNVATDTAGGDGAHNNMQPSAVVKFIIKH